MDWRPPESDRSIHDIKQDDEPQLMKQDQQERSFDSVEIRYLNFDNIKSVIFTKLESSTSQRRTCLMHRIDSVANVI